MPAILDKIAHALHMDKRSPTTETAPKPAGTATHTPVFDANKVTVIFVLGGPGAGEQKHTWYLSVSLNSL
jgi:UMP-CMP kinase